ncbi:MAG TPA: hypothetical protein VHC22_30505 [Pirellulales bacterium]|nr:hypothetical protein [Pirellulales bacterium]
MRREHKKLDRTRFRPAALVASAAASLAAFALSLILLTPTSVDYGRLAAVIRERGLSDSADAVQREQAIAELLNSEHLKSALLEADFGSLDTLADEESVTFIENVRERLRVDLGSPDKAGVHTTVLRWTGDESSLAATRLLNVLARRLAARSAGGDVAHFEESYEAARQRARDASQAVVEARHELESVAAEASSAGTRSANMPIPPREHRVSQPVPASLPDQEDWQLLEQQLGDLERRRQMLGDRLMPEHPEMRALDEKIAALRASVGNRSAPVPSYQAQRSSPEPTLAPERRTTDYDALGTRLGKLGQELLVAQAQLESAAEQERSSWQALCTAKTRAVAEIETATVVRAATIGSWQRWLVAALCGLIFGGLVLAIWPSPLATFRTVEEVRAVTHLPVVVVPRGSLN